MNYFSICISQKDKFGYVDASHSWGLPGIECHDCKDIWANTGISYPTINLEKIEEIHLFEKPRVVDIPTFQKLVKIIKTHFPQLEMLPPGTHFGNLVGELDGMPFNNFVPCMPWTLLLEETLLKSLTKTKLNLPKSVPVNLGSKYQDQKIYEFELLPKGNLKNPLITGKPCNTCKREGLKMPNSLIVEEHSVPKNLDIFRLKNFSTIMIASERFVEKISELEIDSIEFSRIRLE